LPTPGRRPATRLAYPLHQTLQVATVAMQLPSFLDKRKNLTPDCDGYHNRKPGFGLRAELIIEFWTVTFPEPGGFKLVVKVLKKCLLFQGCLLGYRLVGFKSAAHGGGIDLLARVDQNHGKGAEIYNAFQITQSRKPRIPGHFVKYFPHFVLWLGESPFPPGNRRLINIQMLGKLMLTDL